MTTVPYDSSRRIFRSRDPWVYSGIASAIFDLNIQPNITWTCGYGARTSRRFYRRNRVVLTALSFYPISTALDCCGSPLNYHDFMPKKSLKSSILNR